MSVPHATRVGETERRTIDDPDSAVAAWHLTMPDGTVLLTINAAILGAPGTEHYIDSWYRLDARVRGRRFGVLPVARLWQNDAVRFATHRHAEAV